MSDHNDRIVPDEDLFIHPVNFDGVLPAGQYVSVIRDFIDCEDGYAGVKFEIVGSIGNDGKPMAFWQKMEIAKLQSQLERKSV